jgi:hypothetical protein
MIATPIRYISKAIELKNIYFNEAQIFFSSLSKAMRRKINIEISSKCTYILKKSLVVKKVFKEPFNMNHSKMNILEYFLYDLKKIIIKNMFININNNFISMLNSNSIPLNILLEDRYRL